MTIPVLISIDLCRKSSSIKNLGEFQACGLFSADCLLISAFVVGMLGTFSVISMPPVAAYALTGVGGVVVASYLLLAIATSVAYYKNSRTTD